MPEPFLTTIALTLLAALALCLRSRNKLQKELASTIKEHSTSLTQQEEAQRQITHQFLDALQVGLLIVSAQGRIQWVNSKAQTIFGGRDLRDRPIEESFVTGELIEVTREALRERSALSRQITLPASTLINGSSEDSTHSHWTIEITPIDPEQATSTFLIALRDVSSTVRAEQIRKDFVANASHELRTPLTIIGGYVENLLEDNLLEDTDATQHALRIMRKHVKRINRIVDDMLVISRLESGESSTLKISSFNIEECITDVLRRLEALIEKQSATVNVSVSHPDLTLQGDRFYWIQILFNLIENALKQNASLPVTISVSAKETGGEQLLIEVTDNGTGIPGSDLPFIFKRFFRVEKHHSQGEIKGTGLGLSIVKRAVEAHRGTITATSTPGLETRFSMLIPRHQTPPQE